MSGVFLGNIISITAVSVSYDANVTATNTTQESTVTVPGVLPGDFVMAQKPSHSTGIGIVNVRSSAKDTVAITYGNFTGSGVNPAAETYLFCVIRPDRTTGTV